MEYKHTFAGVSTQYDADWKDEFNLVFDSGYETIAVSKQEYKCYLGEKTISYRIGIELQDGAEFDNSGNIYYTMCLVPAFRCLHRKERDDIMKYRYTDEKYGKPEDMSYYEDAILDGKYTVLHYGNSELKENEEFSDASEEILNNVASTYNGITGLIAFYLDRPTNMLGMNGWDWLRQLCNGASMSTILKDIKKRYAS